MSERVVTRMLALRLQRGLSQREVAEAIGVTQPRISQWEMRRLDLPPLRREQIARLLETDPETLLDDVLGEAYLL